MAERRSAEEEINTFYSPSNRSLADVDNFKLAKRASTVL